MNRTITVVSVRKSIKVAAEPDRAFHVFTAGMSRWWLKSHSINKSPIKDIVIEPEARRRWFERGDDGSEREGARYSPGSRTSACGLPTGESCPSRDDCSA